MSKNNKISALSEKDGVNKPEILSLQVAKHIQAFRKKEILASELIEKIIAGDKVALNRAITLIENTNI